MNLESQTLLLIRDKHMPEMWIDRWAVSYPVVHMLEISGSLHAQQWQNQIQQAVDTLEVNEKLVIVAHGVGANAVGVWYYGASILIQRRIKAIILVSPLKEIACLEAKSILQKVRFLTPTALVIGQNDVLCPQKWANQQAQQWHARLLEFTQEGHLDGILNGWQWGMKLMQEMVLS